MGDGIAAGFFQNALGWTTASAEEVRQRLFEGVQRPKSTFLVSNAYGNRYALDFSAHVPDGPVTVRGLWIIN